MAAESPRDESVDVERRRGERERGGRGGLFLRGRGSEEYEEREWRIYKGEVRK